MTNEVEKLYGNRLRVRVCGLCWFDDQLLLIRHRFGESDFWAPPGGGVEFGHSLGESLVREFKEETGLDVKVGAFRFVLEFIKPPLHAIEVFFDVSKTGGELKPGSDPEMAPGTQIIHQADYVSWATVDQLPADEKHGIFKICTDFGHLKKLSGFHRI